MLGWVVVGIFPIVGHSAEERPTGSGAIDSRPPATHRRSECQVKSENAVLEKWDHRRFRRGCSERLTSNRENHFADGVDSRNMMQSISRRRGKKPKLFGTNALRVKP